MKISHIIGILSLLILGSCTAQEGEVISNEAEIQQTVSPQLVELTNTQMEKIGLQLGRIDSQALKNSRMFNGYVAAHPSYKADITSLINGRVVDIRILPGQKVSKGNILMSVENADIVEWQREYITHLNEFRFTEKEYQRQKELYEDSVTAARDFQQIESEYNVLVGDIKSLKTKLEMIGLSPTQVSSGNISQKIPIRSPIDGYVDDLNVNSGAFIQNFESLTTIIDPDHLHIEIRVFEQDLSYIKEGGQIIFGPPDGTWQNKAEIFSIGRIVNPETRTVLVHADIIGPHNLSEGMYVQAKAVLDQDLSACLPAEAIVADQGLSYIFVKDQPTDHGLQFKKVPVLTGVSEMGYTAIEPIEPVQQDAAIVVKGAFYILAQSKQVEGSGIVEH